MEIEGTVSYVAQEPFIIPGTILQNILFGQEFDSQKLEQVTRLCLLDKDFEQMKNGIYTEVGDRGVNLSGGQSQRISLARALYADTDIYLIDDIFNYLDYESANLIFINVIKLHLSKKIRILVTHRLKFVKNHSKVLVLQKGNQGLIKEYSQLGESGFNIRNIFQNYYSQKIILEDHITE